MVHRIILNVRLQGLYVTAVADGELRASLALCPRMIWAAQLAELESVEVVNLTRGGRVHVPVLVGTPGQVELAYTAPRPFALPGDELVVSSFALVAYDQIPQHKALVVSVGPGNVLHEVRTWLMRRAEIDPTSFPVPPRIEFVAPAEQAEAAAATD